jgi:hypothetical protein
MSGGSFGMHNAATGDHPVDCARPNRLYGPKTVAMNDLAVEQVGDRGQTNVWVRTHIQAGAGAQYCRPHLIEKNKRPDHAALAAGQGTAHMKAIAKIVYRRNDEELDAGVSGHRSIPERCGRSRHIAVPLLF